MISQEEQNPFDYLTSYGTMLELILFMHAHPGQNSLHKNYGKLLSNQLFEGQSLWQGNIIYCHAR